MLSLQQVSKFINNSKYSYEINNLLIQNLKSISRSWYIIEPDYKKSICEQQTWYNNLSNGKSVTVFVNNVYRWGSFYIELNYDEKEEILKLNEINLSNYEYELIETWDGGCDFWVETKDEDTFSSEEQDEIESLIYTWNGDIPEGEESDDDSYNEEKMIVNSWNEDDCTYIITTNCKLEESEGP
jgi:hypothetical protein